MATSINVNKLTVQQLLSTAVDKPFVIPEYQRPYNWKEEQVITLFDDLWKFACKSGGSKRKGTYFLGSVVSYENENGEQEIIDGQQRITSLFLLLRAIYENLSQPVEKTDEAVNFMKKIEPIIWRTDKLTGKVDYSNILLESKVINNEGNAILRAILKTGKADSKAEDHYSVNYRQFQDLFDQYAKENALMVYDFIYAVLNQAILLPITADDEDVALTIFSTLNDRGLQLDDADIFKAKIYNNLNKEGKKNFIEDWKSLDNDAREVDESIQHLFYYYMFYLRGVEKDADTTTPGVRKFFLADGEKRLLAANVMGDLRTLLDLWTVVNTGQAQEEQLWSQDSEVMKALSILKSYPNEFWKYPVCAYYLVHHKEEDFTTNFLKFLRKFASEILIKYLELPTVTAVKSGILKLDVELVNTNHPSFDFKHPSLEELTDKVVITNRNIVRMILLMIAYQKQDMLLPERWEIEHILPVKWQDKYFPDKNDDEVKVIVEHIGNKTAFEKRLNIIASNGYFGKKKAEYKESAIVMTHDFSQMDKIVWGIEDILLRDSEIVSCLTSTIKKWSDEYDGIDSEKIIEPTPEELAILEKFKGYKF